MKVLLLTFEENEEDILTRILSCIGNRTEIRKRVRGHHRPER